MDGFVIDRADGRANSEYWTENYEELPGSANISSSWSRRQRPASGQGCTSIRMPKRSSSDAVGQRSPSDPSSCRGMPGRSSWCRPTPRTSSRPGQRVMRRYTSTPTPVLSPSGWSRHPHCHGRASPFGALDRAMNCNAGNFTPAGATSNNSRVTRLSQSHLE
jgi:hypothetical protein